MMDALLSELKRVNADLGDLEALAGVSEVVAVPVHLEVDFSSRCNYRCPMCHQSKLDMGRNQLDGPALDSLIDALPYVDTVMIAGLGEPLLYPGLDRFLPQVRRYRCRSHLFTNGELIHRHLALLAQLDRISISFDGATRETFEYLRRGGHFDRVVANVRMLRVAAPQTRLVTSTVISRRNLQEVSAIVALAADMGFDEVHLSPVDHTPQLALTPADETAYILQLERARELAAKLGIAIYNNIESRHFQPNRNAQISPEDRGIQAAAESWPLPDGLDQPVGEGYIHGLPPAAELAELSRRLSRHRAALDALRQRMLREQRMLAMPYCSAPWKYGFARSRGDARLCPYADLDVGRVAEVLGGRYNSPLLNQVRQSMVAGEPCLSVCRSCNDDHRQFRREQLQSTLKAYAQRSLSSHPVLAVPALP